MSRELGCCLQTEVHVPWVYFSLMDMHGAQYNLGAQQPRKRALKLTTISRAVPSSIAEARRAQDAQCLAVPAEICHKGEMRPKSFPSLQQLQGREVACQWEGSAGLYGLGKTITDLEKGELKKKGLWDSWPCLSLGHCNRRASTATAPTGELTQTLGTDDLTPNHGRGRTGSAPLLEGVVPMTQTNQLDYHPDPHSGPWVGPP